MKIFFRVLQSLFYYQSNTEILSKPAMIQIYLQGVAIQLVFDNPTLSNNDPMYSIIIIATIVTGTVHAVLRISGGFFNPMLATALFGGCLGHTVYEHLFIYWIGSTLGRESQKEWR